MNSKLFIFISIFLAFSIVVSETSSNDQRSSDLSLPTSEVTSVVNLVTTFMLLAIVSTILMPILSGRMVVVPNPNKNSRLDGDVGVLKSLENLFFGGSSQEEESPQDATGYYDENGYYRLYDEVSTEDPSQPADPYYNGYDQYYNNAYPQQSQTNSQQPDGHGYQGSEYYDKNYYANGRKLESAVDLSKIGSSLGRMWRKASNAFNSFDFVDSTFNFLNMESEACRQKAICEVQKSANSIPVFKDVVANMNLYVSGLKQYEDAIARGLETGDCQEYEDACQRDTNHL